MRFFAKIGAIEFAEREVRLAVVKTGRGLPAALAFHVEPIVIGESGARFEAMAAAARRAVEAVRIRPAAYVLCASSRLAVVRGLRLPFRGRRKVAAAVPFELEPFLAFPLEELSVDFSTIREVDGETEVLAVGVHQAQLKEQVEALRAAGVVPAAIGLDAVGMARLWQAHAKYPSGLHAALHVREEGVSLSVAYGRSLAYFRCLTCTAAQMHLNPGMAAREVQNTLRAFQAQWRGAETVEGLCVVGAELFDDERQLFADGVSVPVTFGEVFSEGKREKQGPEEGAADVGEAGALCARPRYAYWDAVMGTAFAAMEGGRALDFARGELAPSGVMKTFLRHAAFSGALSLAALVAAAGLTYASYRKSQDDYERIGAQIWALYEDSFPESEREFKQRPVPDPGGARTYDQFVAEREKHARSASALDPEIFARATVLDVLRELAQAMPSGRVSLTGLRLTGGRDARVIITGEIQDPSAFEQMLSMLRASKVMTVDEEPVRNFKDGKSTFTINAKR